MDPETTEFTPDRLPPAPRFLVRAMAAGMAADRAAACLGHADDPVALLRETVRAGGGSPPPPSAGREALDQAIAGLVDAARGAPPAPASTRCPGAEALRRLYAGALDGPLLTATAEHAADCAACMEALATGPPAVEAAEPPAGRALPIWIGAAVGAGAALAYMFLR